MVDTIYIARHGYRLNWVTTTWKSETGLPRDPPLAAFGLTQAKELANYFLSLPEDERPTAIFSSPYYRCLQTSKPVAEALQVPIYVEHGLSEWYSPVVPGTGLHPRPASASELRAYFPEIDPAWSSVWYPSRAGEDVAECHARTAGCLDALVPEVGRRFGGAHRRILLVSHAATIIALVRALVGDDALPLRVGCCTLSELGWSGEEECAGKDGARVVGAWTPRRLADGSHMKEGASREWGFEDVVIANGQVVNDPGQPGSENERDEPVGCQLPELIARM